MNYWSNQKRRKKKTLRRPQPQNKTRSLLKKIPIVMQS